MTSLASSITSFIGGVVAAGLVVLVASCGSASPAGNTTPSGSDVYYWHDGQHEVSCWLYGSSGTYGKAIACLSDSQVHR